MARPWIASCRPIAVGCRGLRPATNSGSPTRFSSSASVRESAGCDGAEQRRAFGDAAGVDHGRKLREMPFVEFHSLSV